MTGRTNMLRFRFRRTIVATFIFCAVSTCSSATALSALETSEESLWSAIGLPAQGVNGTVATLIELEGKLVAAGSFTVAHDIAARNIAAWDGTHWSAFGSGISRSVRDLTVVDGQIVAATIGGVFVWDGDAWTILDGMSYAFIRAVANYRNEIIAAGSINLEPDNSRHRICRWSGGQWLPMDSGLATTSEVVAFEIFDSALYAANSKGLFRWDDTVWTIINGFLSGGVSDLYTFEGELYVGGRMKVEGAGDSTISLAAWNGVSWRAIPLNHPNQRISALGSYQGKLAIGGFWWESTIPPDPGLIAVLENGIWNEVPMYSRSGGLTVQELLEYDGELFAGGMFRVSESKPIEYLASWTGSAWNRPGLGIDGRILAVASWGDKIVIGGDFTSIGSLPASHIAAWDGNQWSAIGDGLDSTVLDLAVFEGQLIAAGKFAHSGQDTVRGLAVWDGSAWNPFFPNLSHGIGHLILSEGKLFAGISSMGRVLIWDGATWDSTGSFFFGSLSAVGAYQGSPVLGTTPQTFDEVSQLVIWNSSHWADGPSNFQPGGISTFCENGDELLIGGFEPGLTSWSGAWADAYPSPGFGVHAICIYNGKIYVGIDDYWDETFDEPLIRFWNGSAWDLLGIGIDGAVTDMAVHQGSLVVVGDFGTAGGLVSPRMAFWTDPVTDVPDDARLPEEFSLGQNYPNPFNPTTTIEFELPRQAQARLEIFNLLGERILTLLDGISTAGKHRAVWNGKDAEGNSVASGLYLYRLTTGETTLSRKMMLLR